MYQKILKIYNSIKSINAKIKDNLRTFEPNNKKKLRTSQLKRNFTGPYKKSITTDMNLPL